MKGEKRRTAKITSDYLSDFEINKALDQTITQSKSVDEDEFYRQLKEFKRDTSYETRFKGCELDDAWGIEIFKFNPKAKLESALIVTDLSGSFLKSSEIRECTHIAKVIKAPTKQEDNENLRVGDLVTLNPEDTVGITWNPEYLMLMQYRESNMKPNIPEGFQEKVDKITVEYKNYSFLPPHEFKTDPKDITTFAIKRYQILGKYEIQD